MKAIPSVLAIPEQHSISLSLDGDGDIWIESSESECEVPMRIRINPKNVNGFCAALKRFNAQIAEAE